MARLHPVITPYAYWRLVRRRRLVLRGDVLLEAKLDGYLAIAYDGELYTGSGRRAPAWMRRAISEAGAGLPESSSKVLFIEVYGRCATPGGYHRRDKECYRAALVDADRAPAYAGVVEEAVFTARSIDPCERRGLADKLGFETPAYRIMTINRAPEIWELREMLSAFKGYEGFVLKLYSSWGHGLPPDYGAKLRGVLEVKVKNMNGSY